MTISTLSYDSLDSSIILLREGGYRADMQFLVLSSYRMSVIAGSYNKCMFVFVRNLRAIFQRDCTIF